MKHLEHQIQCGIVDFLTLKRFYFFAVPNGGRRNMLEAVRLKREGVKAGVSDLIIFHKDRIYFAEVKTDVGRQSDSQKEFQREIESRGYVYLIWRSVYDCAEWVKSL